MLEELRNMKFTAVYNSARPAERDRGSTIPQFTMKSNINQELARKEGRPGLFLFLLNRHV